MSNSNNVGFLFEFAFHSLISSEPFIGLTWSIDMDSTTNENASIEWWEDKQIVEHRERDFNVCEIGEFR